MFLAWRAEGSDTADKQTRNCKVHHEQAVPLKPSGTACGHAVRHKHAVRLPHKPAAPLINNGAAGHLVVRLLNSCATGKQAV